jgi:hypothetical protein
LSNVLARVLLIGSLAASLSGCGGAPSAVDICHDSCQKQASCNGSTTQQLTTCENACTNQGTNGSDQVQQAKDSCKNADTVINAADECVKKYCSATDLASCLSAAQGLCEAK